MIFMGYLIIGTDNDIYNLVLRRDFEPNRYGIFTPPTTNASDLVLATNYKVDGERLKSAEANEGDLQREQTVIEEELSNAIPEINKMKKISIDIEEENALIKERIKILQKQLEQRKYNVIRLKQENATLKINIEESSKRPVPAWLEKDNKNLSGKVIRLASREDIDIPIEEHLIVELYSK